MGAQEGRHHLEGSIALDALHHTQHLELVGRVKAIAAFDLDAASALGHHLVDALHGLGIELVGTHVMQPVGTVEDAAAAAGNLGIGQAVDFVDKLLLAAAGIHQVGVRVAKRGQHSAATGIDHLVSAHREVALEPEVGNAAVVDKQIGIVDAVKLGHVGAALACQARDTGDAGKRGNVIDE